MKLSKRLMEIVTFVEDETTICDVGCDHGLTAIYCLLEKDIRYAIFLDVNEEPLKYAENNLKKYNLDARVYDLRLGNGLQELTFSEVETVIISGIGSGLIQEILCYNLNKTHSFKKFLLQPTNNPRQLRYWLANNGFNVIEETICLEKNNFYHTLCVEVGNSKLTSKQLFLGPIKTNIDLLFQELQIEKTKLENLLKIVPITELESRKQWESTLKQILLILEEENEN